MGFESAGTLACDGQRVVDKLDTLNTTRREKYFVERVGNERAKRVNVAKA